MQNPNTTPLVPENTILTLQGVKPGKQNIAHGIINLNDFFIKYVLALVAKIGICRWAPDLNDADDSLYNEACQISAIQTFCQLAAGGAYKYMNVNLKFLKNHIVYFTLAKQYKHELKETGKYLKRKERQAVLWARLRLKNLCYTFGVAQKFPRHYLEVLKNVDAHSNEEHIPGSQKHLSSKSLPINFYDPSWFKSHSAGQKTITADAFNVAFLPNASQSLRGAQHPYKRLGDRKFTNKYWDKLIEPYNISHEIPNEEELDETDEETYDDSEVGSSEDEGDEEEEVQEVAESNQLCDEDTPMAEAPEADYFNTGSSHLAFENEWAGW
ncbi:hypothetical protein O181_067459 [Austropuccinia psidii MF-1]|uniref:Uncharacterized protein n=1 Tax=Austropuccinia psidii MF-1 TaxID=1389203 RepID=A0A9Q3EUZ5_9BASI|nr:hypothetical protein [Austropuccinia psidii MF-1]